MLPLGTINMECELVDPDELMNQLRTLKSVNVDGVMVDCWWGIVEANVPQQYNWSGYKMLFQMVHSLKLKLQIEREEETMNALLGELTRNGF
ncbi:beta-amylase 2, chloroplastic-like isoform X3 [Olea europaea var. sylvestris]|uniref:beta-amylase 2, chloroplastic-like isoform X3 n=1 Tax=Olea europaea var. sylvestris TaxID=158386 RepID=UPI000C1CEAD1|nr:beta-amylase 2, chloroplastic-like isoform X3 [Olea europaea var. sylvestris]